MNWRPENWDNPWDKNHIVKMDRATLICTMKAGFNTDNLMRREREFAFEAGADAMLEALLDSDNFIAVSKTAIMMPGFMTDLDEYVFSLGNGRFVFIPEKSYMSTLTGSYQTG